MALKIQEVCEMSSGNRVNYSQILVLFLVIDENN